MRIISRLPRPAWFIPAAVAFNITVFTIMRAAFWAVFDSTTDPLGKNELLTAFYVGFKFDLRLALIVNLPLLLSFVPRFDISSAFTKKLWIGYLTVINTALILFYAIDFGHYAYLQGRLNATVMRFFYNPSISLTMVWETYPVVWGLIGLAGFAALYALGAEWLSHRLSSSGPCDNPKRVIAMWGITAILFAAGIYGKISYYPLRWSDAFFAPHPFSSALASNPVLFFFDTLKNRTEAYDISKVKNSYPLMADYLGVQEPDSQSLNFMRAFDGKARSSKPNIVLVFLESFAFYKTGAFGNPLAPTPNFDRVAGDSLFFRRFYTPTGGTARSVFAFITGIPDVETHDTSTRNPIIVKQRTILNAFKGYEKFYFIGGSANWANIRGLLSHNIPDLHIYEEGSFDASKRSDVWGISDLHLFEEANKVLASQDKPFLAVIQTSGSHRPYTIPDDNRGFEPVILSEEEAKRHGFASLAEFNAFRFMDHSIGLFISQAKKEKYFDDTVFVFWGDHGVAGSAPHIPKAEEQLSLTHFHVPFVIYAPGLGVKGQSIDKIASELDILPTVAALTSTSYLNTTLGRDLFDHKLDSEGRYAFTIYDQATVPQIGLLDGEYYFVMNSDGSNKRLHIYGSENPRDNVADKHPEKAASMERLCRAYYETAKYMIYNNKAGDASVR